jgi:cell division protein FtsB
MTGNWRRTGVLAAGFMLVLALPSFSQADTVPLDQQISALKAELASTVARLKALEAQLGELAANSKATRDTLARELAQPMLLLVGEGRCPAGFERVGTELMLHSGPRTLKNQAMIDRAGLADEEQMGVGSRVYRYLDFCFRAADSVRVK